MDTNGKAFLEHWNWAAEKGVMNKNSAAGLRAACKQVLSVVDNWESVDVKSLDIEKTLTQFQNLKKKDFKPKVLETYKRRFRLAVRSYLAYLEDPGGWKPKTLDRSTVERNNGDKGPKEGIRSVKHELPQAGLVEYPFPLRDSQIARLILPRDLKTSEAKRLYAFMTALVVDSDAGVGAK